uniref:C2H2-type domain-containing protein n=1 Tax=Strongyloides venezuelensis TaxID=75913 RepID=A0A0K0FEQ4_STRVS
MFSCIFCELTFGEFKSFYSHIKFHRKQVTGVDEIACNFSRSMVQNKFYNWSNLLSHLRKYHFNDSGNSNDSLVHSDILFKEQTSDLMEVDNFLNERKDFPYEESTNSSKNSSVKDENSDENEEDAPIEESVLKMMSNEYIIGKVIGNGLNKDPKFMKVYLHKVLGNLYKHYILSEKALFYVKDIVQAILTICVATSIGKGSRSFLNLSGSLHSTDPRLQFPFSIGLTLYYNTSNNATSLILENCVCFLPENQINYKGCLFTFNLKSLSEDNQSINILLGLECGEVPCRICNCSSRDFEKYLTTVEVSSRSLRRCDNLLPYLSLDQTITLDTFHDIQLGTAQRYL